MMPYMERVILSMKNDFGCSIKVVSWKKNKLTPYVPKFPDSIESFNREDFKENKDLFKLINDFSPDLIYVSGRMDKLYLEVVKSFKRQIPIVMGCDAQLKKSLKQIVQKALNYFLYHQYFTHIWIPGYRQYAFARYINFKDDQIIGNLYSGNSRLYSSMKKNNSNLKRVLFVGRLEKTKNIDILIDAWQSIAKSIKKGWILTLIGDGKLKSKAKNIEDIELTGFISQKEMELYITEPSIFCLPSRKEPWGVVVHEFSAAGLPLLLTRKVGASDDFLIDGYNGFLINKCDKASIKEGLIKLISKEDAVLNKMGIRSKELSSKISPKISAASLISILKDK